MARYIETKLIDGSGNPTGDSRYLKESLANSGNMNQVETSPPSSGSRTPAVFGWDIRHQYTPEAKRTVNPLQFITEGQQLYFSPYYSFAVDFFGWMSISDRLKMGINCFSVPSITVEQRAQIPAKSGMYYVFESAAHGPYEGYGFFKANLSEYENHIRTSFEGVGHTFGNLVNFNRLVLNIETSQFWIPGNGVQLPGFSQAGWNNTPHYPNWDTVKNDSIVCESDGVTRTFQQLADMGEGAWINELWYTRRINRLSLLTQVAKEVSAPGAIIAYGTAINQGYPSYAKQADNGLFIEGSCNVTHVKNTGSGGADLGTYGDSEGNITLNGRTYKLKGTLYNYENCDQGYWYIFDPKLTPGTFESTTNYPDLWALMATEHVTAMEKGYWQLCRQRMRARRADGNVVGIMRQTEAIFEANLPRVPFPDIQFDNDGGGPSKIMQPPYWQFSSIVANRFLSGNDDMGNGYYSFAIQYINKVTVPLSDPYYDRWNHHMHTFTAMIQGRMYLQRLERWFTGSTLIDDPDVKISGSWQNYNGVGAYNDGSSQKPCAAIRYKSVTGGTQVEIMIGHNQGWDGVTTTEVRAPNGTLLGGNSFQITYRGSWTRVISCFIPTGTTNQVFNLGDFGVEAWEPDGYAGRTQ